MLCGVPRLVVWCRGRVWAVLCGSEFYFRAVLCWCAGALLFGVLSRCVVGFVASGLTLALAARLLLVSCGALLCRAVLCGVSSCVVTSCVVVWCGAFFGAVLCPGALCSLVLWSAASCCLALVVSGSPALPPPRAASPVVGPVAVAWSPDVARCCALSSGAVLCCSAVPPAMRCAVVCAVSSPVVLRCLVSAGWCRVFLPVVFSSVWLSTVVIWWRALSLCPCSLFFFAGGVGLFSFPPLWPPQIRPRALSGWTQVYQFDTISSRKTQTDHGQRLKTIGLAL